MSRFGRLLQRQAVARLRVSGTLAVVASSVLILSGGMLRPVGAAVQNYSGVAMFRGVACVSPTQCVGVGDVVDPSSSAETGAAAPLDATTGLLPSGLSTEPIAGTEFLQAVACASATQCLSVGENAGGGAVAVPLDPTTGAVSSGRSVHVIAGVGTFANVVCPSVTQCLGVGTATGQGAAVAVPLDPTTGAVSSGQSVQSIGAMATLDGVACASATQCLGVGEGASHTNGGSVPLDPTTGSVVNGQSVQSISTDAVLFGIACSSAAQCLAVGWGADGPSVAVPLDPVTGAVSSGQSEQTISAAGVALSSVACASATQCIAVGNDGNDPSVASAVPLDPATGAVSSGQSVVTAPGAGDLADVICPSLTVCLGVGSAFEAAGGAAVTLNPATAALVSSGPYSPLTPTRICDTRTGIPSNLTGAAAQCAGGTIAAHGTRSIDVGGDFSVPADATTVTLNVTVVNAAAAGYLTAFPGGADQPVTASVTYAAGAVVGNLVQVSLGTNGEVSLFSSAATDVVVDLEGYTSPTASGGAGAGLFNLLTPSARLCDTRAGNPSNLSNGDAQCNGSENKGATLLAAGSQTIQVASNNGVPAGATAAVLNVSAVNPMQSGFITAFPAGTDRPFAANVNYQTGQTTGNRVIVPLPTTGAASGQVTFYSSQATDVVIDVSGYYSASAGNGSTYTSVGRPIRICDTRAGNPSTLSGPLFQCVGKTLGSASTLVVNVAPSAAVPAGATDVVVNVTAVNPTVQTFLTVFPGASRPLSSDLNPSPGDIQGNLTIAALSASGTISVYNNSGSVDVVIDVLGWYS
jgi:hypothetical protein